LVVVGGGGAGVAAVWVVVVAGGGGGGAAVCVVVDAWAIAFLCAPGLCAVGLAAVVVVAVVGCVVWVVAGAATLGLEVDEDEPHAPTISVSRTAAIGMCRRLMVSPIPRLFWLAIKDAGGRELLPATPAGSEQPVNALPTRPIGAVALRQSTSWRIMSGGRCSSSTTNRRSPRSSPVI
jgi:hypothetical protein